jgi:cullin-associated NEDD8-dissociated protein 1
MSVKSLLDILSSGRLTIRKRAIPALGALISNNPALFDQVTPQMAKGLAAGGDTAKVWANVLASLARGLSAAKVGALVNQGSVVNAVLAQTEDPEETDMVEGALVVSCIFRVMVGS